ncbi:RNA polymerase sigma factor [Streptomyces qinglanensis]|uniref:RNA polymerase sigma factor n=1 Tax=Streptomyces qinglanensis TaxID=943816 RepID=UPI003D75FAA6
MSEAAPGADFESFVLETLDACSRLAQTQAGDPHSAQDAVQDVYLNMYRRWEEISAQQGSLAAYGRTAVKRAVIDQFRRNKRTVIRHRNSRRRLRHGQGRHRRTRRLPPLPAA